MVHVDITYTNSDFQDKRGRTLMIGEWGTNEKRADDEKQSVNIDCDALTPKKAKYAKHSFQNRCDSTPSTIPTSSTHAKIKFDKRGRPEHIEVYDVPDDCSISTMGDSVFDDAKPGRSSVLTAKPFIIFCGKF